MGSEIINDIMTKGVTLILLTIKQLLISKKTIGLIVLALIPIIISSAWAAGWLEPEDDDDEEEEAEEESGYDIFMNVAGAMFFMFIIPLIALLYASSSISDEFEEKTITYLISRPIRKAEILIYKYIGYLISTLIIVLVPLIVTFFIFASQEGDIGSNLDKLNVFIIIAVLAVITYGALFFLFSILTSHPIILGLIYVFFWEDVLVNNALYFNRVGIIGYLKSIGYHMLGKEGFTDIYEPIGLTDSVGILFGIVIGCWIITILVFREKDFA